MGTVADVREAIMALDDNAVVIIKDIDANIEYEVSLITGVYDGRYGEVLYIQCGTFAKSWKQATQEREDALREPDSNSSIPNSVSLKDKLQHPQETGRVVRVSESGSD